jgi:hypothetical protein
MDVRPTPIGVAGFSPGLPESNGGYPAKAESGGQSDGEAGGEHTRPRVSRAAPRCPAAGNGVRCRFGILGRAIPQFPAAFPAWAPETARGGACAPRWERESGTRKPMNQR